MENHNPITKPVLLISILALLLMSSNSIPDQVAITTNDEYDNVYYLPLISTRDCIPFPYIQPDNPTKDLEVEDEIN